MLLKTRLFILAGFLLMLSYGIALAVNDGISVNDSVDRANALVGDRIKFTVEIKYRSGTEINFPEFKEGAIGDFEIKDFGSDIRKELIGGIMMRRWYYIAAYSVGKHQIPPIEIKYREKGDAQWKSVQTRALNISIESILPKSNMPADIKEVKGPIYYFEINWVLLSGILIIILIIAVAILYIFRKKPVPVKLPHEIALEELEAARANFLKSSDLREYYAGISDCVRRYIERSFKLKAPEMTTEEFLGSLRDSTVLSPDQKDLLKAFLNACDLVKFAKYTPARAEMESVFTAAKKFIEETRAMFMPKVENGRR